MAAVWVAAIALGIVIYFLPIARLLDSLTETGSPLVGEAPRGMIYLHSSNALLS
jgi:hypothetical protein